jgi:hypothetical protein
LFRHHKNIELKYQIKLFQELLTQQPEKQAVIFLKDVSFANLQALVQVCNIS